MWLSGRALIWINASAVFVVISHPRDVAINPGRRRKIQPSVIPRKHPRKHETTLGPPDRGDDATTATLVRSPQVRR